MVVQNVGSICLKTQRGIPDDFNINEIRHFCSVPFLREPVVGPEPAAI
jgi:hypothetical protein